MMEKKPAASSIDEYIRSFPKEIQDRLRKVRDTVRKAAPEAQEEISYRMPTFHLNGNLVHFAAHSRHIGFYPTPSGIAEFAKELSRYESSRGSVQFPFDQPLPLDLIRKIVEFRVRENTARARGARRV